MFRVYPHYLTLSVRGSNLDVQNYVYRRQILTLEVNPRAVRANTIAKCLLTLIQNLTDLMSYVMNETSDHSV